VDDPPTALFSDGERFLLEVPIPMRFAARMPERATF
jgi:hypothetical protein